MIDLYAHTNASASRNGARSLPRVVLPANQSSAANLRNPNLGMTVEGKPRKGLPPFVDVVGQPSIRLQNNDGSGVTVSVRRNSKYTEGISDDELASIRKIAKQMLGQEKALSKGRLSYIDLAHLNHPYGLGTTTPKGRRRRSTGRLTQARGVSNMAVANTHTGEFLNSWKMDVVRDKNGVSILLINESKQAEYLAFGTKKSKKGRGGMRAHGPFTTAPARLLFALNREWSKLARRAHSREAALMGGG